MWSTVEVGMSFKHFARFRYSNKNIVEHGCRILIYQHVEEALKWFDVFGS